MEPYLCSLSGWHTGAGHPMHACVCVRVHTHLSQVVLECHATPLGITAPLAWDCVLVVLCTLYAVKTRNLPENFNEAKFIGFSMYTTCVIWVSKRCLSFMVNLMVHVSHYGCGCYKNINISNDTVTFYTKFNFINAKFMDDPKGLVRLVYMLG